MDEDTYIAAVTPPPPLTLADVSPDEVKRHAALLRAVADSPDGLTRHALGLRGFRAAEIDRATAVLIALGRLTRERRPGRRGRTATVYRAVR